MRYVSRAVHGRVPEPNPRGSARPDRPPTTIRARPRRLGQALFVAFHVTPEERREGRDASRRRHLRAAVASPSPRALPPPSPHTDATPPTSPRLAQAAVFAGASRGDKAKQLELQDAILSCEDANPILEIVGASLDGFSAINGVTALYRISRCLTSRAGRLRRKEASFVVADRRFKDLVAFVESHARALDRVGLENRKWAYHKLMLPTEYRARAAHAVRQLDRAKDLQGDLLDATDVETILVAVEDASEIFNKVNVSTAVHRVARLATTTSPPGASGGSTNDARTVVHDARFQTLMRLVSEKAPEMAIVSVANALWAMARLQHAGPEGTVDALARRAARECAGAEPRHLSTVMWALAVLGHEPRSRLLAAVGDRALERAEGFKAPDVVNMLWAYARWHRTAAGGAPGSKGTVDALCRVALRELETFTPYQCANLAWSLAMLEAELPSPRALGAILDRAAREPQKLDPTALTHTLWAVGVKARRWTATRGASRRFSRRRRGARLEKDRAHRRRGHRLACGRLRVTPRPGEADALLEPVGGGARARRRRPGARRNAPAQAAGEPGAGARGVGREPDGRRDHERAAPRGGARARAEARRGGEDVRRARRGAQGLRRRRRRGPARHGGGARRRVTRTRKASRKSVATRYGTLHLQRRGEI